MTPPRLLIAVDDPVLLDMIVDVLSQRGFVVAGRALDLPDALQVAMHGRFDGAVVDVKLFGIEVTPLLEQLEASGIRYVLISGTLPADIDSPRLRSLPQLRKPFGAQDLLEAIERLVR